MSEYKEYDLICINCPRGCRLHAVQKGDDLEVTGHSCNKGPEYARQELIDPMRVLTVLMRVEGVPKPISVKTDRPVPKGLLFDCANEIYRTHPKAPVRRGDILIRNILGTGSNVIATIDSDDCM